MKFVLATLLIAGLSLPACSAEPLACNLGALSKPERDRHRALFLKMGKAIAGRTDLADGYAFTIDQDKIALTELAEWVSLEARCCPFLKFGIDVDGKTTKLRLTGTPGVKEFLKAELGM